MANKRITALVANTTPASTSYLAADDGTALEKSTLAEVVAAGRPLASQAEAEAGTNAAKAMTPLQTNQAIVAIGASHYASTAQGVTADSAVQPGDLATVATTGAYADVSGTPTLGTAAATESTDYATAASQVPTGGALSQVLAKASATDHDMAWTAVGAGDVISTNNLSDLADADTSLINLGGAAAGIAEFKTGAIEAIKTTDYTLLSADNAGTITANKATAITFTLPAAATAGTGYRVTVHNIGAGALTVDGDGVETINGAATFQLAQYSSATIWTDGTSWRASPNFGLLPFVDARQYGLSASGTGAANAAALNAALQASKNVYVDPSATYDIGATINVPAYTTLRGAGKYVSVLNKTFSGDMVTLGTGANLETIGLTGNGGTYTGRGVTIGTGTGAQWITNCNIADFDDFCVEYTAAQAGTQGGIGQGTILSRTSTGDICVQYPNDASVASPRYLTGVIGGGAQILCDTGSAQNLFITNCYCSSINTTSGSGKVLIWGTRIATIGATITFQGSDLR